MIKFLEHEFQGQSRSPDCKYLIICFPKKKKVFDYLVLNKKRIKKMLVLIVKKKVRNKSSYFGSCKYTKSFDDLILERDELVIDRSI